MSESPDSIIDQYIRAAVDHTSATEQGDYRRANVAHDIIAQAFVALDRLGEIGTSRLVETMRHHNPGVRSWAAVHLLKRKPELSEPILEKIAALPGLVGFNAGIALREWRKGALKFPPYE